MTDNFVATAAFTICSHVPEKLHFTNIANLPGKPAPPSNNGLSTVGTPEFTLAAVPDWTMLPVGFPSLSNHAARPLRSVMTVPLIVTFYPRNRER